MEYSARVPALQLGSDDLKELERLLSDDISDPQKEITVSVDEFRWEFDSIEELLEDPRVPDFIYNIEISIVGGSERISLILSESSTSKVNIRGNEQIVDNKVAKFEDFVDRRKSTARTYFSLQNTDNPVLVVIALSLFAILARVYNFMSYWILDVLYYYDFQEFRPVPPWFAYISDNLFWRSFPAIVALVTVVLFSLIYNRYDKPLYPYTIISIRDKEFHPYISAIIQIVMVVAAVIAILGFIF